MKQQDCLHIRSVVESKEIFDSIVECMNESARSKLDLLRNHARNGKQLEAAAMEAEIRALESVAGLLKVAASEFRAT